MIMRWAIMLCLSMAIDHEWRLVRVRVGVRVRVRVRVWVWAWVWVRLGSGLGVTPNCLALTTA